MALFPTCPRAGYVILWNGIRPYITTTTCKTWRCRVCRQSLLALARMKVQYGILTSGPCVLTTLTYVNAGESSIRHASTVRLDMEYLLRALRHHNPNLSWMKVPELTKKGQVHLHVVMSGITGQTDPCRDPHRYSPKWAIQDCGCIRHQISHIWFERTGAYVTDCVPVYNERGLGNYLGKYFTKGYMDREALQDLGFHRRYSSSKNWPKPRRLTLQGTADGRWRKIYVLDKRTLDNAWLKNRAQMDSSAAIMQPHGDDILIGIKKAQHRRSYKSFITTLSSHTGGNLN